jgi:large repetitive protein
VVHAGESITTADFGFSATAPVAGSIGDRVWSDTDRDQTQDAGEPGVDGVVVTVKSDPDGDGVYDTTAGTATTAGDGNYVVGSLPPGNYRVVLTAPAGQSPSTAGVVNVVLAPAQVVTDVDFGLATPVSPPFDLSLGIALEGTATAGGTATWVVTVRNSGLTAAPGPITVTDVLPAGLTYVSVTGTGWTCAATGQTVTCTNPGPLAVGAANEFRIRTAVASTLTGSITNPATVSAAGVEITTANNSAAAVAGVQVAAAPAPGTSAAAPDTLPATGASSRALALLAVTLLGLGVVGLHFGGVRRRRRVLIRIDVDGRPRP